MNKIILRREKQVSPRKPHGITRAQLRMTARSLDIRVGRNTLDTLANLKAAGFDPAEGAGWYVKDRVLPQYRKPPQTSGRPTILYGTQTQRHSDRTEGVGKTSAPLR